MQISFLSALSLILIMGIFISYRYKIINKRLSIFLIVFFIIIFILSTNNYYKKVDWIMIGSIVTSITFLLTARALLMSEQNYKLNNKINLIKLETETLDNINKNFLLYKNELSYMYNDIFRIYGNNEFYDKKYDNLRDKSLEFQQSLKIFKCLQTLYVASNYGNDKTKYEFTGILDIFQTFTLSQLLKEYWEKLKYNFSQDFINFLENKFYNNRININKAYI